MAAQNRTLVRYECASVSHQADKSRITTFVSAALIVRARSRSPFLASKLPLSAAPYRPARALWFIELDTKK